ncbi:MAG: hypothetical protein JNL53_20055 [Cyclobacteriaceae bacterium]|nr:hypothetical protein [Cyclobacteriaceae bacterium]
MSCGVTLPIGPFHKEIEEFFESDIMNNQKYLSYLVFLIVLAWIVYVGYERLNLASNHRYTIGYTIGKRVTHKGMRIDYTFTVEGKNYRGSKDPDRNGIIVDSGRYYLEFLPSDPSSNNILWNHPVPNYIDTAPSSGWNEIP